MFCRSRYYEKKTESQNLLGATEEIVEIHDPKSPEGSLHKEEKH